MRGCEERKSGRARSLEMGRREFSEPNKRGATSSAIINTNYACTGINDIESDIGSKTVMRTTGLNLEDGESTTLQWTSSQTGLDSTPGTTLGTAEFDTEETKVVISPFR